VREPALSERVGLSVALGRAARLVFSTWRIHGRLPDGTEIPARAYPFGRQIFALSERDAFPLAGVIVDKGFTALAAFGRDGGLASAALEGIGCRVVRGARRRGGARALREMIRDLAGSEAPLAIVVDGPLGPPDEPKPGIFLCARESGRPIVPLGAAARRSVVFEKAWSKIYAPLPFATITIVVGESLFVPPEMRSSDFGRLAPVLAERLRRARRDAREWSAEIARGAAAIPAAPSPAPGPGRP
jgi:lysophospholipid acyltransferase (LPLAT)-like uncharacterized protein